MTGIKAYRETACGFKSQHIFPHSKNSLTASARSSSSAHDVIMSKAHLRVLIGEFDFCFVLFWKMNEQLLHWWSLLSVFYIFVLNTISETNERVAVCFSVLENEHRDKTRVFGVLDFWFYFEKTIELIIHGLKRNFSALDSISTLATEYQLFVCRSYKMQQLTMKLLVSEALLVIAALHSAAAGELGRNFSIDLRGHDG